MVVYAKANARVWCVRDYGLAQAVESKRGASKSVMDRSICFTRGGCRIENTQVVSLLLLVLLLFRLRRI